MYSFDVLMIRLLLLLHKMTLLLFIYKKRILINSAVDESLMHTMFADKRNSKG